MDPLEILGVCAFVLVLDLQSKMKFLKKLKRRVERLEKRGRYIDDNEREEEVLMPKLMEGLVGKHCCIIRQEGENLEGRILDVDEEWIQIAVEKKGSEECRLVRIESVSEVKGIVSKD